MERADVVVVGAGVMGAATARALAEAGRDVLLLERHHLGHDLGSSHGSSRVFRLSYPAAEYVRLARSSLEAWEALEAQCGETLLLRNGSLDLGEGTHANAAALAEAGETFEMLTGREAGWRWPIAVDPSEQVLFQPRGAVILADRAHAALVSSSRDAGATVLEHAHVESIEPHASGVRVTTDDLEVECGTIVVAAGAWTAKLLRPLGIVLDVRVTRETVTHFDLTGALELPAVIDDARPQPAAGAAARPGQVTYSVGSPGLGLKVGLHDSGPEVEPDAPGVPLESVIAWAAAWSSGRFPQIDPSPVAVDTCLYTSTPEARFVLERHDRVVVGSACSGHGFKFAPAIGLRLAELATT